MKLEITNSAKVHNKERTMVSQQALVNSLLSEKQAVQQQNIQPVIPVKEWGGR